MYTAAASSLLSMHCEKLCDDGVYICMLPSNYDDATTINCRFHTAFTQLSHSFHTAFTQLSHSFHTAFTQAALLLRLCGLVGSLVIIILSPFHHIPPLLSTVGICVIYRFFLLFFSGICVGSRGLLCSVCSSGWWWRVYLSSHIDTPPPSHNQ
eukprot:GHVQ01019830.1.p1 GENE.GHVQ01019830.1~~GHVQ01019830.1.p1  ORF type:complete len:153 (+),score=25.31 GHVQ01019830.1:488-946(+)